MPLADPIGFLAVADGEYDWDSRTELVLDDRYRERQLPLLGRRPNPDLSGTDVLPGEFWPPVRYVAVPIDTRALLADPGFAAFLDELRASEVAGDVWWEGIEARADRVHATLAPDIDTTTADQPESRPIAVTADPPGSGPIAATAEPADSGPSAVTTDRRRGGTADPPGCGPTDVQLEVTVRGPWVGRFNTGRIYLPVQIPSPADRRLLAAVRDRFGAPHTALLAGFLQLRRGVGGRPYERLRALVRRHQPLVAVPMTVDHLEVRDTMDGLVLRSRVVGRIPLGDPHAPVAGGSRGPR
ncbi:hypothetical protein R8Z50_19960 [Longispora sp. K20-0274]|uniref:hypothetical protein n=1 Tax=Longispora sp. K20-0274 TaxID=3088255 RepID=UPI00399A0BF1